MKTIKDNIVTEATCDKCGADCMKVLYTPNDLEGDRDDHDIVKEFEGMDLKAVWGYGTQKDGEIWTAVICEECVDEFSKFINFHKDYYLL